MEREFKEFIKQEWPGFDRGSAPFNHEEQDMLDQLKEAFKAGWDAKTEDIIYRLDMVIDYLDR